MSKEKSSIPVKHGFPNPCYGQALELIRNVAAYRQLAIRIRTEASKIRNEGGKVDMARLFQQCADAGVKADLKILFDDYTNVPKEKPVLGPSPPTSELYGRFGHGVAITDIGSGNCMKLVRSSGTLSIKAVDPLLNNDQRLVLMPFKMELRQYLDLYPPTIETIFTSFMSLPQMSPVEYRPILDYDGMHMVPDHYMLLKQKIAIVREDGMIRVRTGVKDFVDWPVELPGVALEPGYLLCPTYARRRVEVRLSVAASTQSYSPLIDASPAGFYDLNFSDMGPKYDGTAMELEVSGGQAYLVDRSGRQRIGTADVDFHFCVHLEYLRECYVLIRVVAWRGMVPPHHGDMMRLFLEKVTLKIDGLPVLASPRWAGGSLADSPLLEFEREGEIVKIRPNVDGVISRELGHDSYCKYMWTVDISRKSIPCIKKVLEDAGYELDVPGRFPEGLQECSMTREKSVVQLRPLKPRVDKLVETTPDTVLYLVDRPTLAETELITGSYANV